MATDGLNVIKLKTTIKTKGLNDAEIISWYFKHMLFGTICNFVNLHFKFKCKDNSIFKNIIQQLLSNELKWIFKFKFRIEWLL